MNTNLIPCIIFFIIGLIISGCGIYHLVILKKNTDQDYRVIPAMLFLTIGTLLILAASVHLDDCKEYKELKCSEYKIERIITTKNDIPSDTTYIICYK